MRKTTKRAAAIKTVRPSKTPTRLPEGLGSLVFRNGSWWMSYLMPDGQRVQTNTHQKDITIARGMLAERALARLAALSLQLEKIANEGKGSLTRAGYFRTRDGSWAEDPSRPASTQRAQAALRTRQEVAR